MSTRHFYLRPFWVGLPSCPCFGCFAEYFQGPSLELVVSLLFSSTWCSVLKPLAAFISLDSQLHFSTPSFQGYPWSPHKLSQGSKLGYHSAFQLTGVAVLFDLITSVSETTVSCILSVLVLVFDARGRVSLLLSLLLGWKQKSLSL